MYESDTDLPADVGVIDMNLKGNAFMVLALTQAIFFTGCCICGTLSARADKAAEEKEFEIKRDEQYETVNQSVNAGNMMEWPFNGFRLCRFNSDVFEQEIYAFTNEKHASLKTFDNLQDKMII